MSENKYQIYQNFIEENLFEFLWEGDESVFIQFDALFKDKDQNEILKELEEHFSKKYFYQTQEKLVNTGLVFNALKQDAFFDDILNRVIQDYKKNKMKEN